jgi:hypothetical protein
MNKRFKIIRGCPGSWKSTISKQFNEDAIYIGLVSGLYSTDDYFIRENGEYVFVGNLISKAHSWNKNRVQRAVDLDYDLVIVDNTHTQFWEMVPYITMGLENGYEVEFVEPDNIDKFDIDFLVNSNTHGVPRVAIEKMLKRWESTEDIIAGCIEKFDVEVNGTAIWRKNGTK